MGANAQTSVPTFTAGEILTAANMNISARTGIPVFATSTTRDAAFGGTGEKTLAEGQFAYLEDSNTTQYYDGAAWQSVGVAPGLVFITGASFSAVTSFSLPTNTFTSTYLNYKVLVNFDTTASYTLSIKFRASGSDTSTEYYGAFFGRSQGAVQIDNAYSNTTSANIFYALNAGSYNFGLDMTVYNPKISNVTPFTYLSTTSKSDNSNFGFVSGGGVQGTANAFDSMTFISSVASQLTGSYKIYGLANS